MTKLEKLTPDVYVVVVGKFGYRAGLAMQNMFGVYKFKANDESIFLVDATDLREIADALDKLNAERTAHVCT